MSTIEKLVEVAVPVRRAYNQWTQFESFPQFMDGVEEVRQTTDTRTHWRTKIAGVAREFDAEIVDQQPDRRIAWHTTEGPEQGGVVTSDCRPIAVFSCLTPASPPPYITPAAASTSIAQVSLRLRGAAAG